MTSTPTESPRSSILIDADDLRSRAADGGLTILDVRWALGRDDGRDEYARGHIPGAVYVDLETELAAPAAAELGRHPLPDLASLQSSARRWGLNDGDEVVVYDGGPSTSAARAWWLLRWAGVANVRILDGGFAEWTRRDFPVESGEVTAREGTVTLAEGRVGTVDADRAAMNAVEATLVDARAPERYRGEVEPVDPKAGHIPGALNLPTSVLLDAAGRFLPARELRDVIDRHLRTDDPRDVTVYCGSGVTATHVIAGLATVGIDATLYPGSWSQWSNDPSRPVATGS